MPVCTARDTLAFLWKCFSVGSAVSADLTKDKVFAMTVTMLAQVAPYIEAWCLAIHQLAGSPWDFTLFQSTQKFVNGLPTFGEYIILKEKVRSYWRFNNTFDNAPFDFASLADDVVDIDLSFRNNCKPKPRISTSSSNDTPSSQSSTLTPSAATNSAPDPVPNPRPHL
ncbi:hypothetical protein C0992_004141 [Termitomyces sp. T32_za158]|nr:hypothetical protein C0992_004141 [Termitomyces sp. T32_za158]